MERGFVGADAKSAVSAQQLAAALSICGGLTDARSAVSAEQLGSAPKAPPRKVATDPPRREARSRILGFMVLGLRV